MVIYNTQIKSEVVEKYSSYINLTPTVANLFNLDFDPRYYMGTDVFSDEYLNIVTFADGSWKMVMFITTLVVEQLGIILTKNIPLMN